MQDATDIKLHTNKRKHGLVAVVGVVVVVAINSYAYIIQSILAFEQITEIILIN